MKISVGMNDDLKAFVDESENQRNGQRTLGEAIVAQIGMDMIQGNCRLTASRTDHDKKKMWCEFTWEWEDEG